MHQMDKEVNVIDGSESGKKDRRLKTRNKRLIENTREATREREKCLVLLTFIESTEFKRIVFIF